MTSSTASSRSRAEEEPTIVNLDRDSGHVRWEATERHGITAAPGSLALVHDLLNTHRSDDGEPDLLSSRETAQQWADSALRAWSSSAGQQHVPCQLGLDAVAVLQELRDALGNPFGAARPRAAGRTASIEVSVDSSAAAAWCPTGEGVQRLRSIVLGEVLVGQCRGAWPRLRKCRYASCGVTFFDRTWDQRQVWHDTTKPQSHRHPPALDDRI